MEFNDRPRLAGSALVQILQVWCEIFYSWAKFCIHEILRMITTPRLGENIAGVGRFLKRHVYLT